MLASYLDRGRFDPLLLVHERDGPLVDRLPPDLKVRFVNEGPYRRGHLAASLRATIAAARDSDVIVAANEGRASVLALIAAKLWRRPVVAWLHVSWSDFGATAGWKQRVAVRLTRAFDSVVAVSRGVADDLHRTLGGQAPSVIYNPIDVDAVALSAAEAVRTDHEPIFARPVVASSGRFNDQKNQGDLIRAHAALKARGIDHHLMLIGSGDRFDALRSEAARLGVTDTVFFTDFLQNPHAYVARSTVFALSSRFEGFGLVVAEALAAGVPVVSYDCPHGPGEILADSGAGQLVPVGDVGALTDRLAVLLENEPLRAEARSRTVGRARAFDRAGAVARWETLLASLAGRAQPMPVPAAG
ncbi:glycosyltransferase involved in cell wall biosynthesis [Sphingomonas jejuensis]|uniref:Glycosyltransferase involved in cell wall biosynthesis n=2 Tax=Sphingomonas jejuensis TaxID=904715 RepID=A0ABX0XLM9_9SPHN|nr:glycosyltransferase involved in cell wall biosynthesis [Sphingomonas jejuensis]